MVQLFPQQLDGFAEALEVDDLPLPQEADHIVDIRIIRKPENIIISCTGLLLGSQILRQIGDGIAFDGHGSSTSGEAGGCGGVHTGSVIHKIGSKGAVLNLAVLQISGQLMDDGPNHFQMAQFLGADVR